MARQKRRSVGKRTADAAPTWQQKSKSWRKRITIAGEQKEYRYKYPHTPAGAKQAAQEWSSELARIKAGSELSDLQNKAQAILASLGDAQSQNYRQIFSHIADQMQQGIPEKEAQRRGVDLHAAQQAMNEGRISDAQELLSSATGREIITEVVSVGETVSDVLRLYLEAQDRRKELGEIKTLRHASIRRWTEKQTESALGQSSKPETEEELGRLIAEYRRRCEDEHLAGAYGKGSFDDRMKEVRAFVGWASEHYHLPAAPRNLSKLTRKFAVVDEGAKSIPMDVLSRIAQQASGPLAAAIALSLNCGFYSNDIASISEDDISDGYLYFTREKTGVQVCYKLWPETQKLIDEYGLKDPDGKRWYEVLKNSRTDRLGKAFRDLKTGFSYRNLRDTGASLIEQIDRRWTDSYLAHADKRIAKLYIDSNSDQKEIFSGLHTATDRMREKILPVLQNLVK